MSAKKKNYIVKVMYPKDPTVTLRFDGVTEEDLSCRISKLMEPSSAACSLEVFERINLLTKHTTWSSVP